MKIKLKGHIISLGKNIKRLKRVEKVCETLKRKQKDCKLQWLNFVLSMVREKINKVDSKSYETVH